MQTNNCPDPRGNELCTNGMDTYHDWNMHYHGSCYYCKDLLFVRFKKHNSWNTKRCECKRCEKCGQIIK